MVSLIDLAVIVVYLILTLAIVIKISRKETVEDFFVNNRNTRTIFLVFSIVSTSVGAGAVIGTAGAAYKTGLSFGISTIITVISGLVLLALTAPKIKSFGDKYKAYTIGDFFGIRFSNRSRMLVSGLTIIAFFVFTGAQFVAIASLVNVLIGLDFTIALVFAAVFTIAYTAIGGLKGDIYTDFIQFLVMVVAFFGALLPFGILKFGLPTNLPATHFDLFAYAGPVFFFGSIFLGGLYLLASMDWWQRIYSSQNPKQARRIFSYSALVAIPFYLLPIGLGLLAFSALGPGLDPDTVLFAMMEKALPVGLLGLGYAGILAAVMSSVDSTIVVSTASALQDFYKRRLNPRATDKQTLKYARVFAVIFGLAGLVTAYIWSDIVELVLLAVFIIITLVPTLISGMVWKKTTEKAAFFSILLSFLVLLVFLPIAPKIAWAPSLIVGILTVLIGSKLTKHSESETIL